MKLSIIVATRNRDYAIGHCIDSIISALTQAAPVEAEIIIVDNGSTDSTRATIEARISPESDFPIRYLFEPKRGLARARNRALRAAQGELLAITDDDCRMSRDYITDLLRHYSADNEPVIRGGRIELGDPTDLPLTIKTDSQPFRWSIRARPLRHDPIAGHINGCNMTMPRSVVERLGPFDERFGPGSWVIPAGEDSDYLIRAYLSGITLEYVPDMSVAHFHGRKTPDVGRELLKGYLQSDGALVVKHAWKNPNLARQTYRDARSSFLEIVSGSVSTGMPYFSHRDKTAYSMLGALRYCSLGLLASRRTVWDDEG